MTDTWCKEEHVAYRLAVKKMLRSLDRLQNSRYLWRLLSGRPPRVSTYRRGEVYKARRKAVEDE